MNIRIRLLITAFAVCLSGSLFAGPAAILVNVADNTPIRHVEDFSLEVGDPTQPVAGLDPAIKWLIKYQPYAAPDYDHRFYQLVRVETLTTDPHPDFPLYHQCRVTFVAERLPVDDIIEAAKNAERLALQRVLEQRDQAKLAVLGLAVLFRSSEGLSLNQREQAIKTRIIAAAHKIWQNDAKTAENIAAIQAGGTPNLDEGLATAP